MTWLVILTVLIALITAGITLLWWKVADQWAAEDQKKFGPMKREQQGPPPTIIEGFDSESATRPPDAE